MFSPPSQRRKQSSRVRSDLTSLRKTLPAIFGAKRKSSDKVYRIRRISEQLYLATRDR